jgi:hypothetical protein
MDTVIVVLVGVAGCLVVLGIVLALARIFVLRPLGYGVVGALRILAYAAEQGFIGIAVYAACWVFLLPVMLVASFVVGIVESRAGAPASTPSLTPKEQAARWREEDRRFEDLNQQRIARARLRATELS